MMYTPTPATRRPKPPRSLSRQRPPLVSSTSEPTKPKTQHLSTPSLFNEASKAEETPLSTYIRERQADAKNELSRISASPADVSFALDINSSTSSTDITAVSNDGEASSSRIRRVGGEVIGLGLTSSPSMRNKSNHGIPETSPPPPYGQSLTAAESHTQTDTDTIPIRPSTPPRQDSGLSSRRVATSPPRDSRPLDLRQRSTTEGGNVFLERERIIHDREQQGETREIALTQGELMDRLKEMEQLLHSREEELFIAARVAEHALASHEQVMSVLPHQVKVGLPHLQDIYTSLSMALPDSSSPAHFYQQHSRVPSSSVIQPLSPMMDYPSSTGTQHDQLLSYLSPQFPQYSLESPFRIPSPERIQHNSHRHFLTSHNSSSSRRFPVHSHRERPSIFGSHSSTSAQIPTPRYTRLAALQAEAEDRIMALEEALSEAKEGEDKQRKVAARWKKEVDKMQRELVKVDERRAETEQQSLRGSVVGQTGSRRPSHQTRAEHLTEKEVARDVVTGEEKRIGWGFTAFPEFPASGPSHLEALNQPNVQSLTNDVSYIDEALGQVTLDMLRAQDEDSEVEVEASPVTAHLRVPTVPIDEVDSLATTSAEDRKQVNKRRSIASSDSRRTLRHTSSIGELRTLRRKSPKSKYLSSPKKSISRLLSEVSPTKTRPAPPTPRVTIESPHISPSEKPQSRRGSKDSSKSTTSIPRSPWPSPKPSMAEVSPEVRRTLDFSSDSRETSRSPSLSPAFASLNSRIASMRAQINQSLSFAPGVDIGRTLGSELGSEFGDDWDRGLRSLENIQWNQPNSSSPSPTSKSNNANASSMLFEKGDSESDNELDHSCEGETSIFSPVYQPSYPLPPKVSAALSSLAIALAPTTMFSDKPESFSPALSQATLKNAEKDYSTYESLNEVANFRKIKWAENDSPANTGLGDKNQLDTDLSQRGTNTTIESDKVKTNKTGVFKEFIEMSAPSNTIILHHNPAKRTISFAKTTKETPRKYALAHRRINSSMYQARHVSDGLTTDVKGKGKVDEISLLEMKPDQTLTKRGIHSLKSSLKDSTPVGSGLPQNNEPNTIPAKIVYDIFCWISIWLEYMEWFIILAVRIYMEVRSGPRGPTGLRKGERTKRYYI